MAAVQSTAGPKGEASLVLWSDATAVGSLVRLFVYNLYHFFDIHGLLCFVGILNKY